MTGRSSWRKLRFAYEWCVQHPATSETGTATWGDAGLPGLVDCDASLGGDGSPGVAAFVAEELGAAMGVSTQSAMSLMADALDLRHRFPLLWAKVEAWRWRRARPAGSPPTPAPCPSRRARWVDEQLAARVDGFGLPDHRAAGGPGRGPVRTRGAGREGSRPTVLSTTSPSPTPGPASSPAPPGSRPPATPRTSPPSTPWSARRPSASAGSGDTDDYETRKAKALGTIAARQGTLDLTDEAPDGRGWPRRPVQTHLYVHVSLADLATHLGGDPTVGEVEKLGPATLDLIRTWLRRLEGHHPPGAGPQPDRRRRPARPAAVDARAGDPPRPALRLPLVRPRRPDLRPRPHRPYVPPDEGGPPGQTNPRTSHPCAGDITAPRPSPAGPTNAHRDGTYTWTSPHGHTWTVGPDGTSRTTAPAPAPGPSRGVHPRHLTRPRPVPAVTRHPMRPDQAPTPSDPHSDGHFLRLRALQCPSTAGFPGRPGKPTSTRVRTRRR